MSYFNNNLMCKLIDFAGKISKEEVPVAALIADSKTHEIIAISGNLSETKKSSILHAEIIVIYEACQKLSSKYLTDYDIYITHEPCAMCAFAISLAKIKRLYFGALNDKYGAVINGPRIFNMKIAHKPEIYEGILKEECEKLLIDFFKDKR